MQGFLAACMIFLFATASFGFQLSYQQGKKLVLKNNNLIQAYQEKVKSSEFRYYQAKGGYLPDINISETYTNTDEPATAAFSKMAQGEFDMDYFSNELANPDSVENYETKVEILQPVFMKGKIYFGIRQASKMKDIAELTSERIQQEILYNYINNFFGMSLAEKALEVTKKSYERTKRYYQQTKNFYENGMIVKSDLMVAKTHLLKNESAINEAQKQVEVAQSRLQQVLGIDEEIDIVWETPDFNIDKSLDNYLQTAVSSREDLLVLDKQLDIAEIETKKSKFNLLPEVSLFANYKWNDSEFMNDGSEGATFGAKVSFNLFNGFTDYNKIRENTSDYLYMLNIKHDKKRKIRSEVKDAYYSVEAARKKLEAAKKQVEAAYEALSITQNRFKEGLIKITELLDREVDVKQAELSLYMAEYELITSKARLLLNAGILR
ncbi:MAG: TolC family protein [Flexistipes sinusarabici]|uniref:TolC family protein n=2 Tax=Flexistipes sinusarabici TaxID=2352 RepID=A0A5D0MN16_FLESI|nr:MAG: TolC family protein [Flexistipes sinusarabici]